MWKSQTERETLSGQEYLWLNPEPEVTWYGWDGDRMSTAQAEETRIQTLYSPGSFTPLLRIETATEELAKAVRRTLAEKLQQDGGVVFPPELVAMLDNLERELNAGQLSEQSQQWLTGCGLTPEQMKNQMEPAYTPQRTIHLYHCDHRGLPLVLINADGKIAWRAEFDEWGNLLQEDNPDNLQQLIRLPGQQYDQETGLYYNRHRYYDPQQGRYMTQDPIGLRGGMNKYNYTSNPVEQIDPLGLYNLYDLYAEEWRDGVEGTSSTDISGSVDFVSLGGSAGTGIAFGKKKGDWISDFCAYVAVCGHAGIGGGLSAALTETTTSAQPSTGLSKSAGVYSSGGYLGKYGFAIQTDLDNPGAASTSGSIGVGAGAFAGTLTCFTAQFCIVN